MSATGAAGRLTHGTWERVRKASRRSSAAPAIRRGRRTGARSVITRAPDAHDAATDRSWPATVDIATGAVRDLGTAKQYVYAPAFAPNGDRYVYLQPHGTRSIQRGRRVRRAEQRRRRHRPDGD